MTAVRIAHAEPRPGHLGNGVFSTSGFLVVLADDTAHRALPIWFRGHPGGDSLAKLMGRETDDIAPAAAAEELADRLLNAAGASVAGVDIDAAESAGDELDPGSFTARIELAGAAGTRHLAVPFGLGLAMAAAAGAPVRVSDSVLDQRAVAVPGEDLLGPFLDRIPASARPSGGRLAGWPARLPAKRPRFGPLNLSFADGLDRWELDGSFLRDGDGDGRGSDPLDYSAVAEEAAAVLSAAAERPAGSAGLLQTIFADDYRGATVVFAAEIRMEPLTYEAGIRLEILRERQTVRDDRGITVAGHATWSRYQISAAVPQDADLIRFGITLSGLGRIALRHAELTRRG
jgi:bifunctional DNase/RNase